MTVMSEENNENRCSIGWRNLRYETKELLFGMVKKKVILNRLNGCFDYHTLNAFMGPSGAGKTTLLNCLSGNRVQGLTKESEIFLNQDMHDDGGGGIKTLSYFIEQHVEKTIVGGMKVGQILRYAYRFKNGGEGDMERHIRKIIDELLLDEKVLDRKFEKCSGGEQKRIAIAQELMSLRKPTLLFVDEPTTGLDSNAAHLVMQCLKQLATNHRMTVVTSIHVPSDDILNLFDKLYVLAKGGVCIYSGRPEKLRSHLETKIEDLVIQDEQPPIEVLTKIACYGITDPRVVTLSSHTISAEFQSVSKRLSSLNSYQNGVPNTRRLFSFGHLLLQTSRMFQITFVSQFSLFLLQLLVGGIYLLIISSLFNRDMVHPSGCYTYESDNSTGCTNYLNNDSLLMQNVNFHGLMLFYYGLIIATRGSVFFVNLSSVFNNEHRNQWYSVGVYFWSTTISETFQVLLFGIFYVLFGYFYIGQHYVDNFEIFTPRIGHYLTIFLLLGFYVASFGQLIGTILINQITLAVVISLFFYIFTSMLYGIFIDLEFTKIYAIILIAKGSGFSLVFKSILYYLYGWQRCSPEDSYSLIFINYHVDPTEIPSHPVDVLIKIVVVRLTILVYLYWRFNTFGGKSPANQIIQDKEMILVELENKPIEVELRTKKPDMITKRNKSHEELEFEKFSRGKIIVAWRNLSLFGTTYIFEQTSFNSEDSLLENAILKNLNGEIRFGTLNGLMGTSGAGKTSLLKVLNGRDKTRLSGASQFYLSKFTRIQTCFITQNVSGHLLPGLTAKQTLVYASRLKNGQLRECAVDTSQIDHQQIALNLLDELGLSDTADTLVEQCSGGERKRLALAAELTALQMPNLICIDEPTSGLDSNSAEVVVSCLRKLTQTHSITIVASIHQPNSEVLLMFDQIYVLARGGVCIYSGAPTTILPHLQSVPEISTHDSKFPIETLIKHSCHSYPDSTVHQLMSQNDLQFNKSIVDSGLLEQQTQPVADGIQINRRRFSLDDVWILCARYLAYIRGHLWMEMLAYVALFIGYAFFLSGLFNPIISVPSGCVSLDDDFNNTCSKTEEKINEDNLLRYNFQYLFVSFCMYIFILAIQSSITFSRESAFFFNEHRNGWYSSGSFYLMKSVYDVIPVLVILPLYIYICDIYESVRPGIYFDFMLVMILSCIAFQGVGQVISLISGDSIILLMIVLVSTLLSFIYISNFFVPISQLHYIQRTISQFSVPRFMLESVIILLYGFDRCLPKQIQPLMWRLSLDDLDYYTALISLILNLIVFRAVAIALLYRRSNPKQNRRRQIADINERVANLKPTNAIVAGLDSSNDFRIKIVRF